MKLIALKGLENIALTYSFASNVGVIISIAPFFTAIFANIFLSNEHLKFQFFIGFIFAIIGIFLISFNGNIVLNLNPLGDILAILTSIVWAIYSILTKKIGEFHYNIVQSTRLLGLFISEFKIALNKNQVNQQNSEYPK